MAFDMSKIVEILNSPLLQDPTKLKRIFESVSLLMEIVPKFEVRAVNIQGKKYIAILFERPEAKQP
jgi:hypothetical protein